MKTPNQTSLAKKLLFAALTVICVFNLPAAFAGVRTWNGGATPDGNWTNPGNWNGVAPTTNDLLVFSGTTQTATTNNFPTGTAFNNITFNSGAAAFTIYGNAFTLSEPTDAGSGQIANGSINNLSANSETILASLIITNGNHKITSTGGGTLSLNRPVSRSVGAVVTMSGKINVAGGLSTNGSFNILGGWAIYSNNWATLDGSGNVIGYTGYVDVSPGGVIASNAAANERIPTTGAPISITTPVTAINSLLFGSSTPTTTNQTISVGAGNKLVLGQNGGVYNVTPIAQGGLFTNLLIGASLATGGILTAGDGINAATITFGSPPLASGSQGFCTVHSSIRDNGPAPVTVVVAGAYVSLNGTAPIGSTNTYSGGTYILQGRVSQPNPNTFGSGPVYIFPGGQANMGCQVPNDFYIEGSGTTENNGMGALRLYSASLGTGFTGNLPGTIHLMGPANICADNITVASQLVGISGKITGPGSLGIGSPTATSRSGVINIGSTNGAFAIPNDYAGNTTINGINGDTRSSTLRICNPADNNIMPHGATGSYAGGKTGNLLFNATANNHQAIFDLNGSTQSINGLSSISAVATNNVNNIVTDNGSGTGALIIGDNNASSTFLGIVQSGLSLTKIGAGIITLGGPNTYTGDTVVKAGTLATTTASTPGGGSTYSVSNSAALGVSVAVANQTLALNNLTLDSGSSLQLNAGSFGSPATPIVKVNGTLTLNGTVNISLSGIGLTAGGPFPILKYTPGSVAGGGSFNLVNSPRLVATLVNDTVNGLYSVNITSADSGVKWNGGASGNWDINDSVNTIWQTVPSGNTTYYIESGSGNDVATFDDSLTGTPNVNLTTTVSPQALTVNNSSANYLFTGPGKISGATGLTKNGANILTVANSGNNDFSGPIALNAGTLLMSNNWTIANSISGSGALNKDGSSTVTLSGDNTAYSGPVTVSGGTLQVLTSGSLSNASSTTITNGGTLDIGVNSVSLGQEAITVSGAGVGGNGAIVNSSGYSGGAVATSFQNLTLAGDTTIGGPGRLDFRSSDPSGGTVIDANLHSGGLARKLTKVSINTLQISSVVFDPAFGDIDVQGGTLSLQGTMSTLGNPANHITVFNGATLQFFNMLTDINKALALKDGAIVNNNAGSTTYDGPVDLQGTALFNVGGASLTFTGIIGGVGTLDKVTGTTALTLSGANTYSGGTIANAGLIGFSADNNLGAAPGTPTPGNIVLNVGGISASTDVTLNPNRGIAVGPASGTGAGILDTSSTLTCNGTIANNGSGVGGLTDTGGTVFLGGTNTYTGDTTVMGTLALTGNGSISASRKIILFGILDATGRTDGALTLAPGQTLTGTGNIFGNLTNGPGSTISPAANQDGSVTISGSVTLLGTNIMNIDKDSGSYDQVAASGSINFGGTLILLISNNISPLVDGDAFPIYSAASYKGVFANLVPATPGSGLAWNTNTLATDGMLRVTTGPTLPTTNANISSVILSGTNLLVHGTNNNVPNTSFHYAVLTSTNLSLPLSSWTAVVTNPFNADGTFDYTNPIVPGTARQFIDVQAVP